MLYLSAPPRELASANGSPLQHHLQPQMQPHGFKINPLLKSIKRIKPLICLGVLMPLAFAANQAQAQANEPYSSVTFFGDSLTDGGYFKPVTQSQGLSEAGQFTTNPDDTWATPFAENLGQSATANTVDGMQMGNNYAIGGARAGIEVDRNGVLIDSGATQVDKYLADNEVDGNGLYAVWIGANDLLAVVQDLPNANSIVSAAVTDEINTINTLKESGANYILVPNIPNVGLTPLLASSGATLQNFGEGLSSNYNDALYTGLKSTGANIIPLDSFGLLQKVTSDPAAYGFSNVTDKACGTVNSLECGRSDLVEPNANNTYFFADDVHPTGRAHQIIADYATAIVTAPSQIGVLPHIATQSALATQERLQNHINQHQHQQQQQHQATANALSSPQVWAFADISALDVAGFESSGNAQLLLGLDYDHSSTAVTGFYANLSQSELDNDHHTGINEVDLDELGLGVYHRNQLGNIQLSGGLGYANIDMEIDRQISLDNLSQSFGSDTDGTRYYANLQAGYPMQMMGSTFTPYLGASYNRIKLDAIKEKGDDDPLAMSFEDQKYTTTYGTVGVKMNHTFANQWALYGDINYQKQLDDDGEAVISRVNSQPDMPFTTPMIDRDEDSFGMTLGVSRQFGAVTANAGVSHSSGDDDEHTSVILGLSSSF